MPIRKNTSSIHFSKRMVLKTDTKVVVNQHLELEDEFGGMYDLHKSNAAILPPFNPLLLKGLCTKNNILMQCVHAMESNIDGTGFEIVDATQQGKPKAMDPKLKAAMAAAKQPATPGQTAYGLPGTIDPAKLLDNISRAHKPDLEAGAKPVGKDPSGKPLEGADGAKDGTKPPTPTGDGKTPQKGADGILDPNEDTPEEEAERKMLDGFFKEPYPNESFIAQRRKLRVDIEMTGNGYLEVIRNVKGEVVFLRHLDSSTMRLVKLDRAVPVEKEVNRSGTKVNATVMARERRYVQRVGTDYLYFKEFGSERKINRADGAWIEDKGDSLIAGAMAPSPNADSVSPQVVSIKRESVGNDAQTQMDAKVESKRSLKEKTSFGAKIEEGSEVLHFICDKDPKTPYGIPRWINNLPAVLGSRKAEEFNLEFFDAGGLPPAIIFIQGGALAVTVRDQLLAYLSGGTKNKQRAAVVEAQSSSGSLDSTSQVKVSVERFGDSKQGDSLFQNYDLKCEDHVRGAFRMPPIFLGKSADYNFATALTAVMVTEAQVFAPERMEFDEMVNHTIVRALGAKKYSFKSLPITLKNSDLQLKALETAGPKIDGQDLIDTINQITGLTLNYSEAAEQASNALSMAKAAQAASAASGKSFAGKDGKPEGGGPKAKGSTGATSTSPSSPGLGKSTVAMKADLSANDIVTLAGEWSNAIGLTEGPHLDKDTRRAIVLKVESLTDDERTLFNSVLANSTMVRSSFDPEGLAELAGCASGLMDHSH